jgi:hypothetical protein
MPHFGHRPGSVEVTSECMGQTYTTLAEPASVAIDAPDALGIACP